MNNMGMTMMKAFWIAGCIALSLGVPVEQKSLSPESEDWSAITEHTGGLSGYLGGDYHAPDGSFHIGAAPHINLNPGANHVIDGGKVQGGVDLGHGLSLEGHVGGYQGHGVDAGVGLNWNFGKRATSCITRCRHACAVRNDHCYLDCVSKHCDH